MGSMNRNYSGFASLLPVVVGLLLLAAAAVAAEARSRNCIAQCRNDRKGLPACLYGCRFGRTPLHLDLAVQEPTHEVVLPTAECAAYCETHARDFPGKYNACVVTCQSRPDGDADNDKLLSIIKDRSSECDECGDTAVWMEHVSCLIRNHCF